MPTNPFGQSVRSLCFTREDDELLALGYPHLLRLVDDHKDDKNAAKVALKAANDAKTILKSYRIDWPRKTAERFVRAARTPEFQNWLGEMVPSSAFAEDGPVSLDEAHALVLGTLKVPGCTFLLRHRSLYFLLEAMVGTEAVIDAMLDGLDALPDHRWTKESGPDRKTGYAAALLGFFLLRVTEASRVKRKARLQATFDRAKSLVAAAGSESWEVTGGVGMVLEGSHARVCMHPGPYTYLDWYIHAVDDVEKLRALIAKKDTIYTALDVRFVYLVGPEILGTLGKHKPRSAEVLTFLEDIGKIRHELVIDRMLEWIGKPAAKDAPLNWFRAHADFVRPHLERRKDSAAQMMLRGLG